MDTSRKMRMLGLATFVVLGSVGAATAQVVYTVTDLGTLGNTRTKPIAINNLDQITGELYGIHRSFFWEAGVMIDIGTLGGSRCLAWDINNSGHVTGQTYDSSGRWRAFVWDQANGMTNLGAPAGLSRTVAFGMNDAGEVVGYAYLYTWSQPHPVLWSGGHWTTLGTLGGSYGQAKAINNLSHIVGSAYLPGNTALHSALWRDGEVIDLGNLGARDINDLDQILGNVSGHGVLWEDFVTTDLGTLGGAESRANHLNNLGQVVGWAHTAEGDRHAFIWESGVMTDLNERISPASGWVLSGVADISDAGWMTGGGSLNGELRAYLLIPEPDCNTNGIPDHLDIANGTSEDCQPNGVPDECELSALEVAKLTGSDAAAGDVFGAQLSVNGDVVIVGARYHDGVGADSGAAYVFRDTGLSWVEEAKLTASDGAAGDRFGNRVSISEGVALVGAYFDDDAGGQSGSAYVFRYNGSHWMQEAKLTTSDATAGDQFGFSVSIQGDVAVVGAWLDSDAGSESGSAYVFRRTGTEWIEEAKLTASDAAPGDQFGVDLSLSGDVVVVGAYLDDDAGGESGSAYLFRYNGSGWVEEAKLTASDGAAGDWFGVRLSISGGVAVVGARLDDDGGTDSGSAYVFRYNGSGWAEEDKLTASDGTAGDELGSSASIDGNVVAIGARKNDHGGADSGSAYVFRYTGSDWIEEARLRASDAAPDDRFGKSVSISGNIAFVGALRDDDMGTDSGSAYAFLLEGDCNTNGVPDECDIAEGTSADVNGNGIPDECEFQVVPLDIRPGSCPNPLNRNSHGVLPVALVGTESFDATMVDITSVRLSRADGVGGEVAPNEGPPGPHSVLADVATPFTGEPCDCHALEGDGIVDLSMKFRTDDMVEALELNDLSNGDLVELIITGALTDGAKFTSTGDCILIIPPGNPNLNVESSLSELFVEVMPADVNADDSGFGDFQRVYVPGTVVTLTAPASRDGFAFAGWEIDGIPTPTVSGTTSVTPIGTFTTAEAIYVPVSRVPEPAPTPTPVPRPTPRPVIR